MWHGAAANIRHYAVSEHTVRHAIPSLVGIKQGGGMNMIDLDELMRLSESATPGPWCHRQDKALYVDRIREIIAEDETHVCSFTEKVDAAYIVAACNAVSELVQRIRELEAQIYETVGYIVSNESQSMIDCRICFFEQYCERKKDQWKPDPEMCRKAIMHCVTTEQRRAIQTGFRS